MSKKQDLLSEGFQSLCGGSNFIYFLISHLISLVKIVMESLRQVSVISRLNSITLILFVIGPSQWVSTDGLKGVEYRDLIFEKEKID